MRAREKQQLIKRIVAIAGDDQTRAGRALCVTQASVSRYVNGLGTPSAAVLRLAGLIEDGTIPV